MQAQHSCWSNLVQELRGEGIAVVRPDELTQREKAWLRKYVDGIMPVLTPLAIDPAHPFPFMPNMGFSLVLSLTQPGMEEPLRALLPVPNQLERFIRLPGDATRFIPLEDVIALFLDLWFPNFEVLQKATFRVIRDSEMEIDEEAEDLVRTFESALKRRRRGTVIRLTFNADAPAELRDFVIAETDASPEDVMPNPGLLGLVVKIGRWFPNGEIQHGQQQCDGQNQQRLLVAPGQFIVSRDPAANQRVFPETFQHGLILRIPSGGHGYRRIR